MTAFVWNDWSFYAIRFLLGLAEAGFFPGVILYLTWWFPSSYRSRSQAMLSSASVYSLIIGQPISSLVLQMDGIAGLHGWQWLFIIETLPSIVMSVVIWAMLTDRPSEATWLTPEQRSWLSGRLASERMQREAIRKFTVGEAFANLRVWALTAVLFFHNIASYGMIFFLPMIVKGLGVSTNMVGWVSAQSPLAGLVAMNWWGRHSDRSGERIWHVASAWLLFSAGMGACIFIGAGHPIVMMVVLIFATMGRWAVAPVYWALPTSILTGAAAAGGLALVNSVGNLGEWVGPWVYGLVKDGTGSDTVAILNLAAAPIVSTLIVILIGHDRRLEGRAERS